MGTNRSIWRAAVMLALVPAVPAFAEPPELDAAIDAYIEDDYSQMAVIERYGAQGNAEALSVLGQAAFYGLGRPKDTGEGLDLLAQAAEAGDRSAAVQLGRIHENGTAGTVDTAEAARWFVMAADAGETFSSPGALKRLPREDVIAAGGSAYIDASPTPQPPSQTATTAPAAPEAGTSGGLYSMSEDEVDALSDTLFGTGSASKPAPETPAPAPSPQAPQASASSEPDPTELANALADMIFGTGSAAIPEPLTMNDGTPFPLLADTALNASGDAAASCAVVLTPVIDEKSDELRALISRAKTQTGVDRQLTLNRMTLVKSDVERFLSTRTFAVDLLRDTARNGGVSGDAVDQAVARHQIAYDQNALSGPSAGLCRDKLILVTAQFSIRGD